MARKVSKEMMQLWRERVARQAVSGVSIRQFCDQERIPQATFYAWRRRLQTRAATPTRQVTPPRTVSGPAVGKSGRTGDFIPLRLLDAPTAWEVVHLFNTAEPGESDDRGGDDGAGGPGGGGDEAR